MSKIDLSNSIGLNEEVASYNASSLAVQNRNMQAEIQLENAFSPENINAIISQVSQSQASSQDM